MICSRDVGWIKVNLIATFYEIYVAIDDVGPPRDRTMKYCNFSGYKPLTFNGEKDLKVSLCWIVDMESAFHTRFFHEEENVRFSFYEVEQGIGGV